MVLAARFSSSSRHARSVSARSENLRVKEVCETVERDVVRVVTGKGVSELAGTHGTRYLGEAERRTGGYRGGAGERRRQGDGRGRGMEGDRHAGSAKTAAQGPSYPGRGAYNQPRESGLYYIIAIK